MVGARLRALLGSDPFVEAADRPTGLLAVLWGSGGALSAIWGVTGVAVEGMSWLVLATAGFAIVLGAVLFQLRHRTLPELANVVLVTSGALAICLVLWGSGRQGTGAPTVLFVYVGVFAFVAVSRPLVTVVLPSSALHLGFLVALDAPAPFAELVMVWGAVLVASVLIGHAVHATADVAKERARLMAELQAADSTKTAFLHAIGHDLSSPSAVVVSLAESLEARGDELDPTSRSELTSRLGASARRLHDDLTGLVSLEQLRAGHVEIARHPVVIGQLIERAIARSQVAADRVQRSRIDGGSVAGDAPKLEHALANLIGNAAKYAPQAPIEIEVVRERTRVVFAVLDRGPGIPHDQRERIFEPLARARPGDAAHGSGIGLSLVRAFARLHDGEAWVEDRPGGGARFCLAVSATMATLRRADDGSS